MFEPKTKKELQNAVNEWCDNKENAIKKYGDINDWDVSNITDMSRLFQAKEDFNDDISLWNVTNVKRMSFMFVDAKSFNQDISNWNVSCVKYYTEIFFCASSFDISNSPNFTT